MTKRVIRIVAVVLATVALGLAFPLARPVGSSTVASDDGDGSVAPQSAKLNVVVVCTGCRQPEAPRSQGLGTLLLDQTTGKVWFFRGGVGVVGRTPILVGTMTEVGEPIIR